MLIDPPFLSLLRLALWVHNEREMLFILSLYFFYEEEKRCYLSDYYPNPQKKKKHALYLKERNLKNSTQEIDGLSNIEFA